MLRRLSSLVFAIAVAVRGLSAQGAVTSVPIDSGTLVRMTPRVGPRFEGRLLQRYPAAGSILLMCRYPGPPCTDPADSVASRRIEMSTLLHLDIQRGSHLGTGIVIGGIIGAALFSAGSSIGHSLCETADCGPSTMTVTLRGAVAGIVLGALFGGASPRWGPPR
jgi:hypothetical protein